MGKLWSFFYEYLEKNDLSQRGSTVTKHLMFLVHFSGLINQALLCSWQICHWCVGQQAVFGAKRQGLRCWCWDGEGGDEVAGGRGWGMLEGVFVILDIFIATHDDTMTVDIISALLALCEGNPPVTGGFPSQRASNAEHDIMAMPICRFAHLQVPSKLVDDNAKQASHGKYLRKQSV